MAVRRLQYKPHVDHGGVQSPDHDEVGQRSQAKPGKSNEGRACRDPAPQRPGERDPIGTGCEVASELPEGLPHVASKNGNTGLFAQAIATGGDTWARVSRSLSAVPPWTILGTPALSQKSCNQQHRSQTRMAKGQSRRKSLPLFGKIL